MSCHTVLALYRFADLPDPEALREQLHDLCRGAGVVGTLIVAGEGINGTIAGSAEGVARVHRWLESDPRLRGVLANRSTAAELPFLRLKVLCKDEVVKLGDPRAAPARAAGTHVEPRDWDELLRDPEVTLIDTRNAFEVAVGSFPGALDPRTRSFTGFPGFVAARLDPDRHRSIAMFCTGGVRCEKASALLLALGFPRVYQLSGGILRYLEQVPAAVSSFSGECFVFDRRVALRSGLGPGTFTECHGCKNPVSAADRDSPWFEPGVSCPACHPRLMPVRRAGLRQRRRQVDLAMSRGVRHLGAPSWEFRLGNPPDTGRFTGKRDETVR